MTAAEPRAAHALLDGVLLDLDGTLIDSAPDLTRALNALRAEQGRAPLALGAVRNHVSHGSSAVVRVGFPDAEAVRFDALRARFMDLYRAALVVDTQLFPGFAEVLEVLDAHRIPWGIVTNKPAWLTDPLLEQLALRSRARCVLSGDSLARRKPDPLPLLVAAEALGLPASRCLYLGDALRDAQAAQEAGMVALGARYGYLDEQAQLETWPVAGWLDVPLQLLDWVRLSRPRSERSAPVDPLAAGS